MDKNQAWRLARQWERFYNAPPWQGNSREERTAVDSIASAVASLVPPTEHAAALPLLAQPPVVAALADHTFFEIGLAEADPEEATIRLTALTQGEGSVSIARRLGPGPFGNPRRNDRWSFQLPGREATLTFDTHADDLEQAPEEDEETFAYALADSLALRPNRVWVRYTES